MNSSKPKGPLPPLDIWGYLALAYPLGLAPKAPGTFGSLMGLPLGALLFYAAQHLPVPPPYAHIFVVLCLIILSWGAWYVIDRTEAAWQTHDDSRIVIDEVIGQAIPLAFMGFDPITLGLGFILFRFFDIVKPGPIGWADRKLPGAWGTLLDDLIAGVFALIGLITIQLIRSAL